jgi:hypothetical protein
MTIDLEESMVEYRPSEGEKANTKKKRKSHL